MNTILLWVAVAFAAGIVLGEAYGLPLLLPLTYPHGSFFLPAERTGGRAQGRLRWGLGFTLFGFPPIMSRIL